MTAINTLVPGPELTETGQQQAQDLVNVLAGNGIDEIYASTMIRSQETAAPLAEALNLPIQVLPGLNEIDAGIFEGLPVNVGDLPLGGALYLLAPLAWTLGLDFVPQLGSTIDPNGIAFDESFSGAVQSIYDGSVGTDASTIDRRGVLTRRRDRDLDADECRQPRFLGRSSRSCSTPASCCPTRAKSWSTARPGIGPWSARTGRRCRRIPGLPTELFVDFRDLIEAPQFAGYDIYEALLDRQFGDDRERDSGRPQPNRHGADPIPRRGDSTTSSRLWVVPSEPILLTANEFRVHDVAVTGYVDGVGSADRRASGQACPATPPHRSRHRSPGRRIPR